MRPPSSMSTEKYIVLDKAVGQTPLEVTENWRQTRPDLEGVPLAYAGRLDPMASGQLLVLIGEECKKQTEYHHLDKEYVVEVLFGISSDSGDVLGIVEEVERSSISEQDLEVVVSSFVGTIEFPYPVFSAKTVQGKPLHTWAMENRLHEITIPTRTSEIYSIAMNDFRSLPRQELVAQTLSKIELIPPVTDVRKALGNDFRRPDVRQAWDTINKSGSPADEFYIAKITCICSSGTYMRTLCEYIAQKLGTKGLAFSIHRSTIGTFDKETKIWTQRF